MAVAGSLLTSNSNATPAATFNTASIAPGSNRLVLAAVLGLDGAFTTAPTFTLTGNGLTWVSVVRVAVGATALQVFRAMGASPSVGAVTIDADVATINSAQWVIGEFTGVDATGSNGSGAIGNIATNSAASTNTVTVTLPAFGSANNGTYGAFFAAKETSPSAFTFTPGSGFTELAENNIELFGGAVYFGLQGQWRADNDTSVDVTTSATVDGLEGIAMEIVAAAAGVINTETLSDAILMADGTVRRATRGRVASDALSLADSAVVTRTRGRVAGDALLVLDQAFPSEVRGRVLGDAVVVLDQQFASLVRGSVLSDSLSPSDQLIIRREFGRVLGDAITLLDSFTASLSSSTIYSMVLTDGIVTVDQLFRHVSRYRQLSDTVVVVDGTLQALQRMRQLFDAVEVSDGIVRGRLLSRLVADALDVSDSAIATHVPWVDYRFDARILMGAEPSGIILGVDRSIELGQTPTGVVIGGYN